MGLVAMVYAGIGGQGRTDLSISRTVRSLSKFQKSKTDTLCIDVFTHNFYYMGTRGNGGEGGRFIFHNASQVISDSSATPEVFGTREYLNGNYIGRASGVLFGLWGNSKEEANYFMTFVEGEGQIAFGKDELPPLTDIGFWSITAHEEGNWLYTPGGKMAILIRAYQADPEKIGSYVPPAFEPR